MTREQYEQFQKVQGVLYALVDEIVPIETVRGNELFQRLSDAAFEFYDGEEKDRRLFRKLSLPPRPPLD